MQSFDHQSWHRRARLQCHGTRRKYVLIALFLATVISLTEADVCCRFNVSKKPVWENDIALPILPGEKSCEWAADFPGEITFVQPGRLVAAIHFRCDSGDGNVKPKHTLDFLLAIDSRTGKTLKQVSWQDISIGRPHDNAIQLFSVKNHKVLLKAGAFLKLCSADLEELHSRFLPLTNEHGDQTEMWAAYLSPSGEVGVLRHWGIGRNNSSLSEDHWFSTDTLEDTKVELAPRYTLRIAITDNQIYYSPYKRWVSVRSREQIVDQLNAEPVVHVRKPGEQIGQPLCDSCDGTPLQVMPNGLVLLQRTPKAAFWLVDPNGNVMHRGSYGDQIDAVQDAVTAIEGDRFAFSYGHLGSGLFSPGAVNGVVVFDMNKMKDVFQLKIREHPEKKGHIEYWPVPRIALSTNAKQLLVMNGRKLKFFVIDTQL